MNNFLTLDNSSTTAIGIKTNFPTTNLHVAGNAYFSTLEFVGVPLANFVVLGSETV